MTLNLQQVILYSGALVILFLTPGPVWVALIARTVSGGTKSGFPLALGVSLGDMLWPFIVFFGLGLLISLYADILALIRYFAVIVLILMGLQTILTSSTKFISNKKLTQSGFLPGFSAGFIAVTANPKASLFYLTLLPGFFNFREIMYLDILCISVVSFLIPMVGNLLMIIFIAKVRSFLSSPKAVRLTNIISGFALIAVGITIALT